MKTSHGKKITGRNVARDPKDRKVREKDERARGDHPLALPLLTVVDQDFEEKVPEGTAGLPVVVPGSQGPRPPGEITLVSSLMSKVISQEGSIRTS